MGTYFGTDGIRGIANVDLTYEVAFSCANALTLLKDKPTIYVGRDTRVSGEMLFQAISAGAVCGGAKVVDLGIVTTPAVALLTKIKNADFGIVLSASHNPPEFNGIKIFGADGYKISDEQKDFIEEHIEKVDKHNCLPSELVHIELMEDSNDIYIDYVKKNGCSLKGLKIVLDCSNGAGFEVAPKLFRELGADVVEMFCNCSGEDINENCGALHPKHCGQAVKAHKADLGFAFDGDADRLIALDENGNIVNGDSIIYVIAKELKRKGLLKQNTVVGTSHTNMSVENALSSVGIKMIRSDIGDQNVLKLMQEQNVVVGGEQSGHIIMGDISTTGDGILTAVILCSIVKYSKMKLSQLNDVVMYPQINLNLKVENNKQVIKSETLAKAVKKVEIELAEKGRVTVRASGTEPLIRIMTECQDEKMAKDYAKYLENVIIDVVNNVKY